MPPIYTKASPILRRGSCAAVRWLLTAFLGRTVLFVAVLGLAALAYTYRCSLMEFVYACENFFSFSPVMKVHESQFEGQPAFPGKIREAEYAVVEFYTNSCGACPPVTRKLKELARQYPDVRFGVVNLSHGANEGLDRKYDVIGVPAVVFLKKGRLVEKIVGGGKGFEEKIEVLLKNRQDIETEEGMEGVK